MADPVFSDKLFNYEHTSSESADEGFEGSPAVLRTPPPKYTSKWRSPAKPHASSSSPYLIEASPIRIQRTKQRQTKKDEKVEIEEEVKIDFIGELAKRNMGLVIDQIFGHCGSRELQMVLN